MTGKDIAIAVGIVFLWSTNLIVQKIAVDQISIYVLSFLRVAMVFPLIFIYPKPKRSLWLYALCGFFIFGLYLIVFNLGLKEVGANVTSFLTQLQVFFGILAFYLILGEKPTFSQVLGILISFFGVYFLSSTSPSEEFPIVGVLLLIGSCLIYGIGSAFTKKFKIGGSLEDMVWMALVSSGPLLLACLIIEGPSETYNEIVNISFPAFFGAVYATIVITLWTSNLWFRLLQRAPSSAVLPFVLLSPIFSTIFADIFLGEILTLPQFFAGLIILFGVMLAQNLHLHFPVFIYWVKNRMAL